MSIDQKCEHQTLYYIGDQQTRNEPIPLYNCTTCRSTLAPKSVGGTIDTDLYTASVVVYNGLKLERKSGATE